jgi:hypothetical protein
MRAVSILLLFLFVSLVLFGCTQGGKQENTTSQTTVAPVVANQITPALNLTAITYEKTSLNNLTNTTTYSTDTFSIAYPSAWQNIKVGEKNIFFILAAPFENESDELRESVNLGIDLAPPGQSVENYASAALTNIQQQNGAMGTQSSYVTLKNKSFYRITYDSANFNDLTIIIEQTFVAKDNVMYVFTYTAENRSYAAYANVTNSIISSFTPN